MMGINFLPVLVCAILAMALGFVWYGPLFGKMWLEVIKATSKDMEERKKMQSAAGPLYVIQFLLSLFQAWVLAYYLNAMPSVPALSNSLWIWAAFVMPIVAQSAMWNNDSRKISWTRFLLQAGYQLVLFIIFALILGNWR